MNLSERLRNPLEEERAEAADLLDEAEAALAPLAAGAAAYLDEVPDDTILRRTSGVYECVHITLGDCRRAAALLARIRGQNRTP